MVEASLRRILSQLGIQVLSKSSKGWLRASCPFAPWLHEHGTDRQPGFGALICDDGQSKFKCYTCNKIGIISSLVRQLEVYRDTEYPKLAHQADRADAEGIMSMSYEDMLANRMSAAEEQLIPVDEDAVSGAYDPAWSSLQARSYLESRGVTQEASELLELCYDPDDKRVMFPVRDRRGLLFGFSGRTVLPESQYPKRRVYPKVKDYLGLPKRSLLLGENLWQEGKPAFCIEGLIGYASLVSRGVRSLCNPLCLLGHEMSPEKATRLAMLRCSVYLMFDDDLPGDEGLWGINGGMGAVKRLTDQEIITYVPSWPEGKSDPDELVCREVAAILHTTMPWSW